MSQHLNLAHKPPSKPTMSETLNLLPMPPTWQHKNLPPNPKEGQNKLKEHIEKLPTHSPTLNPKTMPPNHPIQPNQISIKSQPSTRATEKYHNEKVMMPTHTTVDHNKLPTHPPLLNENGSKRMIPTQSPHVDHNGSKALFPDHTQSTTENYIRKAPSSHGQTEDYKTIHKLPTDQDSIKPTHTQSANENNARKVSPTYRLPEDHETLKTTKNLPTNQHNIKATHAQPKDHDENEIKKNTNEVPTKPMPATNVAPIIRNGSSTPIVAHKPPAGPIVPKNNRAKEDKRLVPNHSSGLINHERSSELNNSTTNVDEKPSKVNSKADNEYKHNSVTKEPPRRPYNFLEKSSESTTKQNSSSPANNHYLIQSNQYTSSQNSDNHETIKEHDKFDFNKNLTNSEHATKTENHKAAKEQLNGIENDFKIDSILSDLIPKKENVENVQRESNPVYSSSINDNNFSIKDLIAEKENIAQKERPSKWEKYGHENKTASSVPMVDNKKDEIKVNEKYHDSPNIEHLSNTYNSAIGSNISVSYPHEEGEINKKNLYFFPTT